MVLECCVGNLGGRGGEEVLRQEGVEQLAWNVAQEEALDEVRMPALVEK